MTLTPRLARTMARRAILVGGGALALVGVARAATAPDLVYKGVTLDVTAADPATLEAVTASMKAQIDIVDALAIRDEAKAWLKARPLRVLRGVGQPGRFRNGRIDMDDAVQPVRNPVLLHEMLHAWQYGRVRLGVAEPHCVAAWERARASGDFPPGAYMLSNRAEFFAMTVSVALWGVAARPPFTREAVRRALPDWYAWIEGEFGLTA